MAILLKDVSATIASALRCKDCQHYGTISEVAQQRAQRYQQVEKLLLERTSLRGIQRVTGVSRPTLSKLIKKGRSTFTLEAKQSD